MKYPASQALFAYWSSLCRGRRAPERNELDPAAMRHVLPQTFVLDVDGDAHGRGALPIRLSGTRLDALFSSDLKGADFVALWAPEDRDLLRKIVANVLDGAEPAVIGGLTGPDGVAAEIGFELLLLPLRHQGRTHARLLGGLSVAATPTWMGLRPASPLTIGSWRLLAPTLERASRAGSAERHDRRARFTVYEGGRSVAATTAAIPQGRVKPALSRWGNHR